MKPTYQTLFGGPDGPKEEMGNCYPACLASLLEVPLESVPHVYQLHEDKNEALAEVLRFLDQTRHSSLCFDWADWVVPYLHGSYVILSGKSPRGDWSHAVVGRVTASGWEVVHDPHPSGDGFIGEPTNVEVIFKKLTGAP